MSEYSFFDYLTESPDDVPSEAELTSLRERDNLIIMFSDGSFSAVGGFDNADNLRPVNSVYECPMTGDRWLGSGAYCDEWLLVNKDKIHSLREQYCKSEDRPLIPLPTIAGIPNQAAQDEPQTATLTSEKKTMTKFVNLSIVDNSAGIKEDSDRLVGRFTDIATTKTDDQLKMQILMEKDVASLIKAHNAKRVTLVDEDILNRTGNEVTLRPVELHELDIIITDC